MSSSIPVFFDYHLLKKCSKGETICLKLNFHLNKNCTHGLKPFCEICCQNDVKKYFIESPDGRKRNCLDNSDKINSYLNEYFNNRINRDDIFR